MKKILAFLTSAALCLSMLPVSTLIASAAAPQEVLILGDSIASGYALADTDQNFGDIIGTCTGADVTNLAVPGKTTTDLLSQLGDSATIEAVKNADTICISIGGNDALRPAKEYFGDLMQEGETNEEFFKRVAGDAGLQNEIKFGLISALYPYTSATVANIPAIEQTIRNINGDATILFQTLYNPLKTRGTSSYDSVIASLYSFFQGQLDSKINKAIKALPNSTIVDVEAAFQPAPWIFVRTAQKDVHPTPLGHAVIAAEYLDALGATGTTSEINDVYNELSAADRADLSADMIETLSQYASSSLIAASSTVTTPTVTTTTTTSTTKATTTTTSTTKATRTTTSTAKTTTTTTSTTKATTTTTSTTKATTTTTSTTKATTTTTTSTTTTTTTQCTMAISGGSIQGAREEYVLTPFYMEATPDVAISEMELVFHLPEGFKASGLSLSAELQGEGVINCINNIFTWSSEDGTALPAPNGILLYLVVDIPTSAEDGTYSVSIDPEASTMSGSFGTNVSLASIATLTASRLNVAGNATTPSMGDINNDGNVDADDAVLALREYASSMLGNSILTTSQQTAADVNRDGNVDADDAVLILKFYAKHMTNPDVTWEDFFA